MVTPFSAQARLIRRRLRELDKGLAGITVGTAHSLQGAELPVVLFSATYGEGAADASFINANPELMNVAVSRAKDLFIVFGAQARRSDTGAVMGVVNRFALEDPCDFAGASQAEAAPQAGAAAVTDQGPRTNHRAGREASRRLTARPRAQRPGGQPRRPQQGPRRPLRAGARSQSHLHRTGQRPPRRGRPYRATGLGGDRQGELVRHRARRPPGHHAARGPRRKPLHLPRLRRALRPRGAGGAAGKVGRAQVRTGGPMGPTPSQRHHSQAPPIERKLKSGQTIRGCPHA